MGVDLCHHGNQASEQPLSLISYCVPPMQRGDIVNALHRWMCSDSSSFARAVISMSSSTPLAGSPLADSEEATIRLRLRIPAIRSFRRQEKAKAELLDAVAAELLSNLGSELTAIAA